MIDLSDIKSRQLRNTLRGLIGGSEHGSSSAIFDRLAATGSIRDVELARQLISDLQRERRITISLPFPPKPPAPDRLEFNGKLSTGAFIQFQQSRLRIYKRSIIDYLGLVNEFDAAVSCDDAAAAASIVVRMLSEHGFSIYFTRKVLSAYHIGRQNQALQNALAPYREALYHRRHVVDVCIEDTFDPERDYTPVRRHFLRIALSNRVGRTSRGLLLHHLSPIITDLASWVFRARAHAAYSLPDYVMFALEADRLTLGELVRSNTANLPADIRQIYGEHRGTNVVPRVLSLSEKPSRQAAELHRVARGWLTDPQLASYLIGIERFLGPRLDGDHTEIRPYEGTSGLALRDVPNLTRSQTASTPSGMVVGDLQRTAALVHIVEQGGVFDDIDGLELARILESTSDVASLLSPTELDGSLPPKLHDPLYEMLRATLLFDSDENVKTDFHLRSATEDLIRSNYNGSPVAFLREFGDRFPDVAEYYANQWSEHFLTQLYALFDTAYAVNEARRQILEWHGLASGQTVLIERARSLGLENKLARMRHEIDSQRLYVDPVRFSQWISTSLADAIRDVATSEIEQETPASDAVGIDDIDALTKPELELAFILDRAFKEFCTNKAYGIDSYVGRRIRHGTFAGTLISAVQTTIEGFVEEQPEIEAAYGDHISAWLSQFAMEVKRFATERLQLRSDIKPKGIILPTAVAPNKHLALRRAIHDLRVNVIGASSTLASHDLIIQHCWQILEPDLIEVRRELDRWRGTKLVLKSEALPAVAERTVDDRRQQLIKLVNEQVSESVRQISAWFATPKEITPSATMLELFQVVLQEVGDQVPGFDPNITTPEDDVVRIVGHRYQYVYDALYILVHNAAQHGRASGPIGLRIESRRAGDNLVVDTHIDSEIDDDGEDHGDRITFAMTAPLADALVTEGSSGIRKLRALADEKREISDVAVNVDATSVHATFRITLPST